MDDLALHLETNGHLRLAGQTAPHRDRAQRNRRLSDVQVKLIIDADATVQGIKDGLTWLSHQATARDLSLRPRNDGRQRQVSNSVHSIDMRGLSICFDKIESMAQRSLQLLK